MSTPRIEIKDMPAPALLGRAERQLIAREAEVEELRRQLEISRNVEASLRRDLALALDVERRWTARIKALEARLERVGKIASGHTAVEGVNNEGSGGE